MIIQAVAILSILTFAVIGCSQNNTGNQKTEEETYKELQEQMVEQNKQQVQQEREIINQYIQNNNLKAKETATGLFYVISNQGSGKMAQVKKKVKVHYTGKFMDGKVFDSSVDRNEPFEFVLGTGQVIKGWDEGIALLREADKVTLILPSHLAYGPGGVPNAIPPYSTLIFDVELLEVVD